MLIKGQMGLGGWRGAVNLAFEKRERVSKEDRTEAKLGRSITSITSIPGPLTIPDSSH